MVKNFTRILMIAALGAMLAACAGKAPQNLAPFTAKNFDAAMYQGRVDNFLIILDASSSLNEKCNGVKKFEIAKAVVERLNQTTPEVGFNGALRTFGHNPAVSKDLTKLFYGPESYSTAKMAEAINLVTLAGGTSPMAEAIIAGTEDLKALPGKSAVIMISDGEKLSSKTLKAAESMKAALGSNVCFYTVLVGQDPEGAELLNRIAETCKCGFATKADALLTSSGMANFVESALIEELPPVIAQVEEVIEAIAQGEADSDGDGIPDSKDRCPGTPRGAIVDIYGCWSIGNILFDFDKSVIKQTAYPELNGVAAVLNNAPAMDIILKGYTDSVGSEEYNLGLSLRRAQAVKNYLTHKGISADRIACEGLGEANPIAPNDNAESRALNRRVQVKPVK